MRKPNAVEMRVSHCFAWASGSPGDVARASIASGPLSLSPLCRFFRGMMLRVVVVVREEGGGRCGDRAEMSEKLDIY